VRNTASIIKNFVGLVWKLANSSAERFRTLPLRLGSLIHSAAAYFASACTYLGLKNCLVLIFMFELS